LFVEQPDVESAESARPVVARRVFAALMPIVLGLVLTTTASAAQRYASPTGVHANPCTQALPCDIVTAINDAGANDEVIVEPGSYGSLATPLTTGLVAPNLAGISIHGVAGEARPQIYTDVNEAMTIGPASTTLSGLDIEDSYADALGLYASNGTISDMLFRTTGSGSDACVGGASLTIVDSVCDGAGSNNIGLDTDGISCDNQDATQTISNSDFYATGSGDGLDAGLETNCDMTINATNVIARGGTSGEDVAAENFDGGEAVVSLAHSDYVRVLTGSEGMVTPAGTATNIEGDPELVNPAGEDFHETAGSPTINAGLTSAANGTEDFDGQPRTEGGLTDIGADEYLVAPTVSGGASTGVGAVVATLTGSVNPGHDTTSYTFHYGTTQALGESSATQTLQPALSAQSVSASISGLAAGTTYYWDIVATNTVGTNTSTINTLTTVAAPQLSLLTVSPAHFRATTRSASAAKHKAKKAAGTTISYQDTEAATTTFAIEQYRAGEERSGRCVAEPAHQKRKPGRPCRRLVALGSFTHIDTAGANLVHFSGRLGPHALARGSYTITATPSNSFGLTGATRTATFHVKG
jgi:hypothetical protein